VQDELVARRDLVEPAERDAGVREEVHGVPPLVAEPAPHDPDRRPRDDDEEDGADRRGDHPRIDAAGDHRPDLLRQRVLVELRVAPEAEEDVRDQQVDRRVAVPPVPHAQPVEADRALEHRQPGEEEHLDEREVRAEQAGDPGDADEDVARAPRRQVAPVHPQGDDDGRVREDRQPDERDGHGAAGRQCDCARRRLEVVEGGHAPMETTIPESPLRGS
jgi:hypothetical protein